MKMLTYGLFFAALTSTVYSWLYGGGGGRGGGRGSSSESRDDWWADRFLPRPADNGLREECPDILEAVSEDLSQIADEMPAHYSVLIPALELPFSSNILSYPIEADTSLYNAIGEFVLAADNIDDIASSTRGCTRLSLMTAVKKLNTAIKDGLLGVKQIEEALATVSVPTETSDRLDEWIGAFQEALSLRNDLLECFAIEDIDGEDEGGEGEGGEGEGGDGDEGGEGGTGEQVP